MSTGLPWFRFYADFINDPVIEELAPDDQRHYVFILCMKCSGMLDKDFPNPEVRERAIARRLGLQGELLTKTKQRLRDLSLIDVDWNPTMWDEMQKRSDTSTERTRKYRASRNESSNESDAKRHSDGLDIDSEKEKEKREEGARAPDPTAMQLDLAPDIKSTPKARKGDHVPLAAILDLFHQHCTKLSRVKVFSEKRKRAVRQRWIEQVDRQTLAWWVKYFSFINDKCPFLTGANDRNWRADFDFVMGAENMIKVIENKYVEQRKTGSVQR